MNLQNREIKKWVKKNVTWHFSFADLSLLFKKKAKHKMINMVKEFDVIWAEGTGGDIKKLLKEN